MFQDFLPSVDRLDSIHQNVATFRFVLVLRKLRASQEL